MDDEARERIKRLKEGSWTTDVYKIEEYIPDEEDAAEVTENLQKEMKGCSSASTIPFEISLIGGLNSS